MSRLGNWYERCAILWKARTYKPKDPAGLASKMDSMLGPSSYGDRSEAAKHYGTHGAKAAKTFGSHPEGSSERLAFEFSREIPKLARAQSKAWVVNPHKDTLTKPIDQDHIKHYGEHWATHNNLLEHSPSGKALEDGLRSVDGQKPYQMRSLKVMQRIKQMKSQGHAEPYATKDDLQTIHTGVERAIQAGKVPTSDANRYHVMRHAVKLLGDRHAESYPGLPFQPSYAAMDTAALRVMKTGVDHLHETGFNDAKKRLGGMLGSAIESHSTHPFMESGKKAAMHFTMAVPYPALHEIGSDHHTRQKSHLERFLKRVSSSREDKELKAVRAQAEAKEKAKAAEPKPLEMPKSYEEFRERQDRGEAFDPQVVTRMEMERRRNMKKSLLADWKAWRGEAA